MCSLRTAIMILGGYHSSPLIHHYTIRTHLTKVEGSKFKPLYQKVAIEEQLHVHVHVPRQSRHGNKTGANTQSKGTLGESFPDIAINTITIPLVCPMFMPTFNRLMPKYFLFS